MMIKAVIFDMDGLLIDSEPLWKRAQLKVFRTVGLELTDQQIHQNMGRGVKAIVEHYYHEKPWQGPSQAEIEAQIVDDLLRLVKTEGKLRPGAKQTLELCKAHSLPMAIASSSSHEVINTVIDSCGIRGYFDQLYSGQLEPHSKPHPGVFITTAGLLGVMPRYCLVFEDAPNGVLAAKAAGMTCIAVPEPEVKQYPFIQTADVVIDSLEQFNEDMLARL